MIFMSQTWDNRKQETHVSATMLSAEKSDSQSGSKEENTQRLGTDVDYFFGKYKRQLKIQQEEEGTSSKAKNQKKQQTLAKNKSQSQADKEKDYSVKKQQGVSTLVTSKVEPTEKNIKPKQRPSKKITEIDLNDPQEVESYLKRSCRDYHKSLMEGAKQHLKLEQEQPILKQEQRIISIDSNLNYFPLDSQYPKLREFQSILELKEKLRQHQQDIIRQLNNSEINSIFYNSLQQKVKKGEGGKKFHNFTCTISGCHAIIKCLVDLDKNIKEIYLLRNCHSHTITGHVLEPGVVKKPDTVILDEDLHEMFGFNKGVRSQTRNLRYVDPLERKKIEYQKKRQRILKRKRLEQSRKKQMLSQNSQEQGSEQDSQAQKSTKVVDHSKKFFLFNNKKVEDIQFKNIPQQLNNKGYICQIYPSSEQQQQIPAFAFVTKKQLLDLAQDPTTLRICHRENIIKLDKRRGIVITTWAIMILTMMNQNLQPLVLGIFILSRPIVEQIPKVLRSILKYFPNMKFLVSEYESNLFCALKKQISSQPFQLLLDHNDILKVMKKYFRDQQHINALKELMNPINNYKIQSFEKYLRKRNQKKVLDQFQQFKNYTLISHSDSVTYQGIDVDLSPEKELFLKIKQRVRSGLNRYSLKLHLQNIFDWVNNHNKTVQIIPQVSLQIQKFHHDFYLKAVRMSVGPAILNQFYLNYGQSLIIEGQRQESGQVKFQKGKARVNDQMCSCGYTKVIGIPCKHLIFVLKNNSQSYLGSFHKKWILKQEETSDSTREERSRSRDQKRKKKGKKGPHKQWQHHQRPQGYQQRQRKQDTIDGKTNEH